MTVLVISCDVIVQIGIFYILDVFWMGFGILKDFTPWDPLIALHPKEPVPLAAGPLPGNLALRRPLFGTSKGCWFNL